ncbi:MAG: hypothetical protein ACM31G_05070 [Flavobacteriales bacterium]
MTEFWEEAFKEKKEMWGLEPAKSAILTKDFFVAHQIKNVLIPGIGYGRNAQQKVNVSFFFKGGEASKH